MIDSAMQTYAQDPTLEMMSVDDFFRQINWYGGVTPGAVDEPTVNTPYETVGQFFATFPWHQGAMATVPSNSQEPVRPEEDISIGNDSLTLEDLSALF